MPKQLTIALDFDGTFTEDPHGWYEWVVLFRSRGHTVYVITMRHDDDSEHIPSPINNMVDGVYYTGRKAKRKFMEDKGVKIDIWIDDRPETISMNAKQAFGRETPKGEVSHKLVETN